MKRIMLYNHGGCGNRGCEAIVRSTAALYDGRATVCLASDAPQEDRAQRLERIEKIVHSEIAPYSVRRFVNSIGFRLGIPREQEVARKHATVTDLGKKATSACPSAGTPTATATRSICR